CLQPAQFHLRAVQLHCLGAGQRIQRSRRHAKIGPAGTWPDSFPDHHCGSGFLQTPAAAPAKRRGQIPLGRKTSMSTSESVVNLSNPVYKRRQRVNRVLLALSSAAVVFGLFWLFWIILTLLLKGGSALSLSLLTEVTPPPGADGGLFNAIFGSVAMAVVATLIGT